MANSSGQAGVSRYVIAVPEDGSVSEAKLAPGAVTASRMADGAVETAKIDDEAVTADKMAPDSVTVAALDDTLLLLTLKNQNRGPVRAVSTSNVNVTGGAPNTLDGVTLLLDDRILVAGNTDPSQNGVRVVSVLGTGSNGTWSRAIDADEDGEVFSGLQVYIQEGSHGGESWHLTSAGIPEIDVDDQVWELLASGVSTGYVDAGDADTLAAAEAYTDAAIISVGAVSQAYVDDGDADTLSAAEDYADLGDASTYASANSHSDVNDAITLSAANSHSDAADATTLTSANSHSDAADATTLASAHTYSDSGDATTLSSANTHSDNALAAHVAASDPHTGYQKESEKGNASGYASLDGSAFVPAAQLPAATTLAKGAVILETNSADTSSSHVVTADDTRLSDARTPTAAAKLAINAQALALVQGLYF